MPRIWLSAEIAEWTRSLHDVGWRYRGQGVEITTDEEGYATWSAEFGPKVEAFSERGTWRGLASFDIGEEANYPNGLVEIELSPDITIHLHVGRTETSIRPATG